MTLRRKQLVGETGLRNGYAALSLGVTAACLMQTSQPVQSAAAGAGLLLARCRGWGKYTLWGGVLLAHLAFGQAMGAK